MSTPSVFFLADSSAWIEFLRATGTEADRSLSVALRDGLPVAVTGVIVQEVLQGCRGEAHARDVARLIASCLPVEPVYPESYDHAASLYRRCRAAGRTVRGTVDCLVGAVALEHRLPVLGTDRDLETLHEICSVPLWRSPAP